MKRIDTKKAAEAVSMFKKCSGISRGKEMPPGGKQTSRLEDCDAVLTLADPK